MNWNKGVSLPQLRVGVWGRYNLTFSFRLGPHPAGKRSGGQRQRKMTTWNLYKKKWVKMALALSTVSMPIKPVAKKTKKFTIAGLAAGFLATFEYMQLHVEIEVFSHSSFQKFPFSTAVYRPSEVTVELADIHQKTVTSFSIDIAVATWPFICWISRD